MKTKYVNEIRLLYHRTTLHRQSISSPGIAAEVARQMFILSGAHLDLREYFFLMLLNRQNSLIGFHRLSEGGITGTVCDQRMIFALALKSLSTSMILIHNHPSGSLQPSECDLNLTKKLKRMGDLFDIAIADHLILSSDGFYSFADNGLL